MPLKGVLQCGPHSPSRPWSSLPSSPCLRRRPPRRPQPACPEARARVRRHHRRHRTRGGSCSSPGTGLRPSAPPAEREGAAPGRGSSICRAPRCCRASSTPTRTSTSTPTTRPSWNDQVMKETLAYRTIAAVHALQGHPDVGLHRRCATWAPRAPSTPTYRCRRPSTRAASPAPACRWRRRRSSRRPATALGRAGSRRASSCRAAPRKSAARTRCCGPCATRSATAPTGVKLYADYRRGPNGSNGAHAHAGRDAGGGRRGAGAPGGRWPCTPRIPRACAAPSMAGAQTIEHGYGGTDETFTLMAERGVALLPDARRAGGVRRSTTRATSPASRRSRRRWSRASAPSSRP